MPHRLIRSFQGLILLGLCLFFASKAINGQLTWYINARFIPLTLFGIIFLAILAQTLFAEVKRSRQQDDEHDHHHEHSHTSTGMWIMLIPLAIGILIPARPLDSSAFDSKGLNNNAPIVSADSSVRLFETESEERNILDWLKLFNYNDDVNQFIGQTASVIGFVYFDEALGENQFYVSRFVVSCCAADGFAIAIPVKWNNLSTLEQDSWVQVKGTIETVVIDERNIPLLVAESIQPVPIPEQPYLFP